MNVVVLLSGGLDSSTLVYSLKESADSVLALSILYGQRHAIELESARLVAQEAGVQHRVVDLGVAAASLLSGSALTGGEEVPHGHYAHESMKATVVPNRNMVLLALAGAAAISRGANAVAYAAHAGDHAIYPDCRPEFIHAMGRALDLADYEPLTLLTPFSDLTKADIVQLGDRLGVPFALTYSCYEGKEVHCGACGTCVERREAFELAGVEDPTLYQQLP